MLWKNLRTWKMKCVRYRAPDQSYHSSSLEDIYQSAWKTSRTQEYFPLTSSEEKSQLGYVFCAFPHFYSSACLDICSSIHAHRTLLIKKNSTYCCVQIWPASRACNGDFRLRSTMHAHAIFRERVGNLIAPIGYHAWPMWRTTDWNTNWMRQS